MTVWYFVREFSESEEFPEVHLFWDEQEARATMITEALEVAAYLDGWVTEVMDGPSVTHVLKGSMLGRTVTSLNVERKGGAVDCFRLMSQELN